MDRPPRPWKFECSLTTAEGELVASKKKTTTISMHYIILTFVQRECCCYESYRLRLIILAPSISFLLLLNILLTMRFLNLWFPGFIYIHIPDSRLSISRYPGPSIWICNPCKDATFPVQFNSTSHLFPHCNVQNKWFKNNLEICKNVKSKLLIEKNNYMRQKQIWRHIQKSSLVQKCLLAQCKDKPAYSAPIILASALPACHTLQPCG